MTDQPEPQNGSAPKRCGECGKPEIGPTERELGALLAMIGWINDEPCAVALSSLYAKLSGESAEAQKTRYERQRRGLSNLKNMGLA